LNHDFLYTLILPMLQPQTQQMMASQIKSHTEYFNTNLQHSSAHFVVKVMRNVAAFAVLIRLHDDS